MKNKKKIISITTIIFSISIIFALFQNCGQSGDGVSTTASSQTSAACANSIPLGRWSGTILGNPDILTFNSNCTGSSQYCGSTFTYPNVLTNSGSVLINITSTAGSPGCLGVGQATCTYSISGNFMTYSCGGPGISYTKIP